MAELLINQWGWIGDDTFLVRENECIDMDWIDIRTTPRKIQAAEAFKWSYWDTVWTFTQSHNYLDSTIDWLVSCYDSRVYIGTTNVSATIAGADMSITLWVNVWDYNATTNPEWVRHFFFTYNAGTNPILVADYVWWVFTLKKTINTSAGVAPADILDSHTRAVCYLWKWSILFARSNKIYELNPDTEALSAWWAKVELPVWAVVKYIYYYNWLINFVYTINNDTFIHWCTYDGTTFKLNTYYDKVNWDKCLSAVWDRNNIYWISTSGIFQYQWTSQLVKKVTFWSSAVVSYYKWVLNIWDDTNYYKYWVNKPWYWSPLTKITTTYNIKKVSAQYVLYYTWTAYILDQEVWWYKSTNYYITAPYTAWVVWDKKNWLWIKVWYSLPRTTYTDSSVQCTIDIYVQTMDMYNITSPTYIKLVTISDKTKSSYDLNHTTIAIALQTAGYSDVFDYIRFKIVLNAGDPVAAYGNTLYRKTPEVYDFHVFHEEIQSTFK